MMLRNNPIQHCLDACDKWCCDITQSSTALMLATNDVANVTQSSTALLLATNGVANVTQSSTVLMLATNGVANVTQSSTALMLAVNDVVYEPRDSVKVGLAAVTPETGIVKILMHSARKADKIVQSNKNYLFALVFDCTKYDGHVHVRGNMGNPKNSLPVC